jgi:hypothetical protein
MNFFRIFDSRNGSMSLIQAHDMNHARRALKKSAKWSRIPKRVFIQQMTNEDVQNMFQVMADRQKAAEEAGVAVEGMEANANEANGALAELKGTSALVEAQIG